MLLRNVERGSQMMTKLRATRDHSHSASTARSSKSMSDERNAFNSGVFETRVPRNTVPNIVSRSTSAHYRCYAFKCSTWLVIRSGRQNIQFKKTCDCRISYLIYKTVQRFLKIRPKNYFGGFRFQRNLVPPYLRVSSLCPPRAKHRFAPPEKLSTNPRQKMVIFRRYIFPQR
jgi:hypothetical protein